MKNFKFNPKIALIVTLILITGVGVYLYLNTTNNSKKTNQAEDRGFLSFFGDRKIRPVDETTVPGVSNNTGSGINNGDSSNTGLDDGSTIGGGSGAGNTAGLNNNLSLKPIGINTLGSGGTGSSGDSGLNNRFTGGQTGGSTAGGSTATGGGTGTNIIPPVEQVNCTPRELEFTDEEKKKLKDLEARFYKLAAEIRSEQDVETLVRTRQNYYNYLSSDYSPTSRKDGTGVVELTKQCFAERNQVVDQTAAYAQESKSRVGPGFTYDDLDRKYPLAYKPLGLRPNPFITKEMFNRMASIPPLRQFLNKDRLALTNEIKKISSDITASEEKIRVLFLDADKKLDYYYSLRDNDNISNVVEIENALKDYNQTLAKHDNEKARLFALREQKKNLDDLLNQSINDPFSYFANNTTYIVYEKPAERETELSRKNAVYQSVQSMFYGAFGDASPVINKIWGNGDWGKASKNPLKDSGFAKPCNDKEFLKSIRFTTNPLVCYEEYYPVKNLERFLGIW